MVYKLSERIVDRNETGAFLPSGTYGDLRRQVSSKIDSDIPVVLYYAFDWSTRIGPFVGPDIWMPNCGIRSVGGALYEVGFKNTRIIFGPWNPNFDASKARINGKSPEVLGVGSMQIHEADAHEKIEQAHKLGDERPLIIGGGPHANYQAWDFFDREEGKSVDIAVRGEQYVTLSLVDRILDYKGRNETMLQGFERAKRQGGLESVRGIMYMDPDRDVLIDTGQQSIVADIDELPREIIGLRLLEPRHKSNVLSSQPAPLHKLRKNGTRSISINTSAGCNLRCDYCPIPKNHQYTERAKSPGRMVSDIREIQERVGRMAIFGTDDNAFAFQSSYLEALYGAMASASVNGIPFRDHVFMANEGTIIQAHKHRDMFPLMRDAGLRAVWFGVEDLSEELVKKGQKPEKTKEVFCDMRENGISPMPMLMHFDGQPLRTKKGLEGLLNQVEFLGKQGAGSMQVTINMPSIGSKDYEKHFKGGTVLKRVGNMLAGWNLYDGNHAISTSVDPLKQEDHVLSAYELHYSWRNRINAGLEYIRARLKGDNAAKDVAHVALAWQMWALEGLRSSRKNMNKWKRNLATRIYEYWDDVPKSQIPMFQWGNL